MMSFVGVSGAIEALSYKAARPLTSTLGWRNVTKNGPMNRIDEEWVSADCLAHYLRNVCRCNDVQVQKAKDDPPDFWITVDGHTFAAEVTSIVTDAGYRARGMALMVAWGRATASV